MAVDESMLRNTGQCWVLKLGGLMAVVYWLIATVRSTVLIEDSSFLVNLYNPGLWDLLLRILTVVGILGVSVLIHRRHSAVDAERALLEEQLGSMKYMLEEADYPIIHLDQQLRITNINKAAASLAGAKGDELNYQYIVPALFYSEDHEEIKALLEDTRTETEAKVYRLKVRRVQPCHVTIRLAKEFVAGKITQQLLFLTDVSDATARLNAAEKRIAGILDQVANHPLPVAVFDLKHVHFANHAMQNMFAMPEPAVSYEKLMELIKSVCGDCETLVTAIAETLKDNTARDVTTVINDGEQPQHVIVHVRPYELQDAAVLMWIEDTTELAAKDNVINQLEQDLELLRKNESDLRAEYQQHTEKCSEERHRLLEQLSSEQQQAVRLSAELEATTQRIALLEQQIKQQAENSRQFQEQIIQLRQDNTSLTNSITQMQFQWEAMQLPIMQVDQEGRLIKANPAARTLLGIKEDTLLQSYVIKDEQLNKLAALLQGMVNETQRFPVELEFYYNGQQVTVNCYGIKLHKPEDQFLLYGYDITTYKQAQTELAMTLDNNRFELEDVLNETEIERERMNAILAGINDGIVITDMYNRVIKMNPAAEDMLGIRLSQALERPVHFIIRNPEIIGHIQQTVRERLYNHKFTLTIPEPDAQSTMSLACSTTVIHDRNLYDQGVIIQLHKLATEA